MVTVAVTDGPALTAASSQVAPLSSEYCSLVTATLSLAEMVTLIGPRYHGLRMPVNAAGSSVAAAKLGAVVSVACAAAGATGTDTVATAASASQPFEIRLIRSSWFVPVDPLSGRLVRLNTNL